MDELFAEYAGALARGERPRAAEFLARAGADADRLAPMIERLLQAAPRPTATAADAALLAGMLRGEPPLLELRKARRLKRGELVRRLTGLLGLAAEREQKVGRYYHELETGLLESRGVDARVWEALQELLGTDVRALARWRPAPVQAPVAYRVANMHVASESLPEQGAPGEEDEVDRLFRSAG